MTESFALLPRLISLIAKPLSWVWKRFSDDPKLYLQLPEADGMASSSLPVHVGNGSCGDASFLIGTLSSHQVELSSVTIAYSAPLSLSDNSLDSGFKNDYAHNSELPFALLWNHPKKVVLLSNLLVGFRIQASFGEAKERTVEVAVVSNVIKNGWGGVINRGSLRQQVFRIKMVACSEQARGIAIKPKHGVFMPQVRGEDITLNVLEGNGPMVINYLDSDGRPHSQQIIVNTQS